VFSLPTTIDNGATALFLDIDGTLLDIRDRPEEVAASDELVSLLDALSKQLGGALSLISGRSVADIDRVFAPVRFPAAGSHGAEIRLHPQDDVATTTVKLPDDVTSELVEFAASHDGLLLEHKLGGASLHYRMAPDLEEGCRRLMNDLMVRLGRDFRLIPGKMVFELAPLGHNKGQAIAAMMEREPFTGRRPVFVGDDVTDEDGFHVVNEMEGVSVRVGENRDSAAACTLESVAAVRHWLETKVNHTSDQAE
jgi:trehalose 6-phosphate phosphatase